MKEKDIIPEFMKWFSGSTNAIWHYKIPDNRFTGKKPFDVVGAYRGDLSAGLPMPLAFEFKIHKTLSPWPLKKVIDYQVKSLEDFSNVGGDARVVLGVRLMLNPEEQTKFKYPTRRANFWVWWPISDFVKNSKIKTHLDIRDLVMKGTKGYVDGRSI